MFMASASTCPTLLRLTSSFLFTNLAYLTRNRACFSHKQLVQLLLADVFSLLISLSCVSYLQSCASLSASVCASLTWICVSRSHARLVRVPVVFIRSALMRAFRASHLTSRVSCSHPQLACVPVAVACLTCVCKLRASHLCPFVAHSCATSACST